MSGGLSLQAFLAALGLSFGLVLLLYLLRPARRRVVVASVALFQRVLLTPKASVFWGRLAWFWSLLLHWAILGLLLAALWELSFSNLRAPPQRLIFLLDTGLSMQARDAQPSRIEAAKAQVRALIAGMGEADTALVVEAGVLPIPRSGVTHSRTELLAALDPIRAHDCRPALDRALLFARAALPQQNGLVVLVSDGTALSPGLLPDLAGLPLRFVPVGKSGANLAITAFSARRHPLDAAAAEVMVELANFNSRQAALKLTLESDGQVIALEQHQLAARERKILAFRQLGGAAHQLKVALAAAEPALNYLAADDQAALLLPARRRVKVKLVSPGNTYLEAVGLLDEAIELRTLPWPAEAPGEHYDLVIFDGIAPPPPADAAALYINPPPGGFIQTGKALANFGFDSWERKHPILANLALSDVQVAAGFALSPRTPERGLGYSEKSVIFLQGQSGDHAYWALGFDPRQSDFVLRPAWPLFVLNLIRNATTRATDEYSSFRTGGRFWLKTPGFGRTARLLSPKAPPQLLPIQDDAASFTGEDAGNYSLQSVDHPELSALEFSANITHYEASEITPRAELPQGLQAQPKAHFSARPRPRYWAYFLALAALLSVFEWGAFHKRLSV